MHPFMGCLSSLQFLGSNLTFLFIIINLLALNYQPMLLWEIDQIMAQEVTTILGLGFCSCSVCAMAVSGYPSIFSLLNENSLIICFCARVELRTDIPGESKSLLQTIFHTYTGQGGNGFFSTQTYKICQSVHRINSQLFWETSGYDIYKKIKIIS